MRSTAFFTTGNYQVLKGLEEPSRELMLVHVGTEECKPFHIISDPRTEYIIHFVLSGAGFYSAHGNTWPLHSGQMFLICPGEPIVYGSERNNPWTYAWIGFKGIRAESILKQCGFSKNRLVLPVKDQQEVQKCIQEIIEHKSLAPSDALCREAGMLRLFALLAKENEELTGNSGIPSSGSGDALYVELGCEFIKEMYMHTGIGVKAAADHIGIPRARLNRAFQSELHKSVQQYLIDYRLRQATTLLMNTPLSIKEISAKVGYSDQLVFSRAFKKKYGVSPKGYRLSQAPEDPAATEEAN